MTINKNLRALYTFISNKSFGQLLDISPKHLTFSKTFENRNSKSLEIEDKINITLVIN